MLVCVRVCACVHLRFAGGDFTPCNGVIHSVEKIRLLVRDCSGCSIKCVERQRCELLLSGLTCDSVQRRDQQQRHNGNVDVQVQSLVDEDGARKHVCLSGEARC